MTVGWGQLPRVYLENLLPLQLVWISVALRFICKVEICPKSLSPAAAAVRGAGAQPELRPGRSGTVRENKGGAEGVFVIRALRCSKQLMGQGRRYWRRLLGPCVCARYSCDSKSPSSRCSPGTGRGGVDQKVGDRWVLLGRRGGEKERDKAELRVNIKRSLASSLTF